MTIRVKITTENTLSISNDKIEREIINLKEDELLELIKVCIANEKKFKVRRLHVLAGALALVLIATIATLIVVFTPSNYADNDYEVSLLKMVTRKEWYAENSTEEIPKLKISPAPYVIIAHTVTKECNTTDACKSIVRNIQAFHISMDYGDIGYNFLVGGDGEAYEGLGWDLHGAHTIPFNSRSIGLAFIGNFVNKVPPRQQIKAAQLLLEEGLRLNKLTPNYKIFGHKQIMATESPGQKLMEIIETWAHWAPYNAEIDG